MFMLTQCHYFQYEALFVFLSVTRDPRTPDMTTLLSLAPGDWRRGDHSEDQPGVCLAQRSLLAADHSCSQLENSPCTCLTQLLQQWPHME